MLFRSVLTLTFLYLAAAVASATPIIYSLSGDFSGTLGGASFTDAATTITFVGDTSNVVNLAAGFPVAPSYHNDVGTGTFTIAGFGSGTFLSSGFGAAASDEGGEASAGFSDVNTNFGISALNAGDPNLASYQLTTPILASGDLAGEFLPFATPTTLGDLVISTDGPPTAIFQAITPPVGVPELNPTNAGLACAFCCGSLLMLASRRLKQSS